MTTHFTQDLQAPLSQMLAVNDGTRTTQHIYGAERLAATSGSIRTWPIQDALGSVRATLDDTGLPLTSTTYDPWGQPTSGAEPSPFGFTGEYQNQGLVYLRARWYQPGNGRFTGQDPFAGWSETPYSLHVYQYGYSDPVRNTDPTGQCVSDDPGCIEEQLKQLFNITIDYPRTDENRSHEFAEKKYWWFYNGQDLRANLLSTLKLMDSRLNHRMRPYLSSRGASISVYRQKEPSKVVAARQVGKYGQWIDPIIYVRDATLNQFGIDGFNWTVAHEFGHAIDNNFAKQLRDKVDGINVLDAVTCWNVKDGPTWYVTLDGVTGNIYDAGIGEDWADSVALFVWSGGHDKDVMNNPDDTFFNVPNAFFKYRRAIGANSSIPNAGDGRGGWWVRYGWVQELTKSL